MPDATLQLGWARKADATVCRFTGEANHVPTANRTFLWNSIKAGLLGPPFFHHLNDFWDHVTRPLHHNRVSNTDILPNDFVLVVERRVADAGASDPNWFELSNGGNHTGSPD